MSDARVRRRQSGDPAPQMNFRKHLKHVTGIDPCSSAPWFAGWRALHAADGIGPPPVATARSWLAGIGWRRHGLLDLNERPKSATHVERPSATIEEPTVPAARLPRPGNWPVPAPATGRR